MKGSPHVAKATRPAVKATPKAMSSAKVSKAKPQVVSVGKMANVPQVKLGTTHGNHNVNHPL